MKCEKHSIELGEGIERKICLECYTESNTGIDISLEELREKQKIHRDTILCTCQVCAK